MYKYAKIINEEKKTCDVGLGTNAEFYKSIGMTKQEVEQDYNGVWYLYGYCPVKPQGVINKEEILELKQKLADSDYVVIKIAEGAASAAEYAALIEERKQWRARINELGGLI